MRELVRVQHYPLGYLAAGFFNMLMRNADIVPISDMTGIIEFAGIWKKRGQVYAASAYYAFRMYSNADATRPVAVETHSGLYDVHQGVTRLPEIEGVPYLDVVAAFNDTWDPPTFFSMGIWEKTEPKVGYRHYVCCEPLVDVWGGSAAPYVLTAGALNSLLSSLKTLHAKQVDLNQTMSICAWRASDGNIRLLAANLEEGLHDDNDSSRHATLVLPDTWKATTLRDLWSEDSLKVTAAAFSLT